MLTDRRFRAMQYYTVTSLHFSTFTNLIFDISPTLYLETETQL